MGGLGRIVGVLMVLLSMIGGALGAGYPVPVEGDWVAPEFRFHGGEVMRDVRLHYTTVGDPSGLPVLVLHGTAGSGTGMLSPGFGGVLFGPGQPLDAHRYFVILPDGLGAGKSAKPSDGMRAAFPHYNYDDMVLAQYRLVTEGLGIKHLRLVIGNSMGGMQAWEWGVAYPGFMDALVPMASTPAEMSGRNWMMRRMLIEAIRRDPGSLRMANAMFGIATSGGTLAYQAQGGTRAQADRLVEERLAGPLPDADDFVYQWDASRDFNPAGPGALERIGAAVLAINSADDERNPPETGLMERAMQRVRNGRVFLIPASTETRGHGTTGMAAFYAERLRAFLAETPAM